MNGYRRQLARSHEQLRGNKWGEHGSITCQGAKDSNSNLEKWAARLTVTNEVYIKSNQPHQQTHTHRYPEPVYYFIFTFQYFVT